MCDWTLLSCPFGRLAHARKEEEPMVYGFVVVTDNRNRWTL